MNHVFKYVLCFLIVLCGLFSAKAGHIIGGELFYDCLGGGNFKITLRMYRNCFSSGSTGAPFDNPANIGVFRTSTGQYLDNIEFSLPISGSFAVNPNTINPCYSLPPNVSSLVCIEGIVYEQIVNLPFEPGGITLSYQRCCRPNNIVNIQNPSDVGTTYTIDIPPIAWTICNSSPRFNNLPPIVLCQNLLTSFESSATDPDGDVLVYSLCNPFEGGTSAAPMPVPPAGPPYSNAPFLPGYSATAPFNSTPAMTINASTGLVDLTPALQGWHVVAFCVSEYRNGVLLSVNKRDFQLLVINSVCNPYNVSSNIYLPNNTFLGSTVSTTCTGLEYTFKPSPESLIASLPSPTFLWDFGVIGATADVSTLQEPTFTFPDEGTYTITLTMYPESNCPSSSQVTISVYNPINLTITVPPGNEQCITTNNFDFTATGGFEPGANFNWVFGPSASSSGSALQSPTSIVYSNPGTYPVVLDVTDPYCSATATSEVIVHPALSVSFAPPNPIGCVNAPVAFSNTSTFSPGASVLWDFGDGNTSTQIEPQHVYNTVGVYDVSLTIDNTTGCVETQTVTQNAAISVNPSPTAELLSDTTSATMFNPVIQFSDLSLGAVLTDFDPGDGSSFNTGNITHTYSYAGDFWAVLKVENTFGCLDKDSLKIKIEPYFSLFIPNAFSPDGDGINDYFGPVGGGITQFAFRVFNRWGELIFESDSIEKQWDGTLDGGRKIAKQDVYAFTLSVVDYQKQQYSYTGKITLLR
jgi:gliding motility-associated-like protein